MIRHGAGVAALLLLLAASARGGESLQRIEKEFQAAIAKATPATVVCVAKGVPAEQTRGSSGVMVSRRGLVLSDGDAGLVVRKEGQGFVAERKDDIEVRVPDLKKGGFTAYAAKVLRRLPDLDSSLLRIEDPPSAGFPGFLLPSTSDHLQVGDFAFAVGNSFGLSDEAPPSLTAGVISSLVPLAPGAPGPGPAPGRLSLIYTSAAVNPGVNGGPLVDVEGRLVGTISGHVVATPDDPYQFLGKAIPIDRVRAAYADLPEVAEWLAAPKPTKERSRESAALEGAFHAAADRAAPSVVSLEIVREAAISRATPQAGGPVPIRYEGPVSGVLLDGEGRIATSLYNLASLATLEAPPAVWPSPPPDATVEAGLKAVKAVVAHLPDGRSLPARVVGHDPRLGVALLRADLTPAPGTTLAPMPLLEPAPPDTYKEGRFVVALGNPFGAKRLDEPLVAVGILSKRHADDAPALWRGQWQTDAGGTDGNCGGAVVDLRGRVAGMLTLWSPARHGRNSGIAFVVPWGKILAAVPDMEAGKVPERGFLGVQWVQGAGPAGAATIEKVTPDSPAALGGLRTNDVIVGVNGDPVSTLQDVVRHFAYSWAGDRMLITVRRGKETVDVEAILAARPKNP